MGKVGEKLDIDFVVSTGDNFYENGLTGVDDQQFEESFTKIYTAKSLQKPWYLGKVYLISCLCLIRGWLSNT
jgi:tartrate-resistant acid phosphatase type 5